MDWWNWYFPKENEAMARVQTQESWLSSISKMSQDDENMMSTWWYHHESSELFIHGEIESGTSAFAHMCMPFDIFVAKIAKDVREVLNGNKDSVKRYILANTDNSDSRGSHWVPVVYELIKTGPQLDPSLLPVAVAASNSRSEGDDYEEVDDFEGVHGSQSPSASEGEAPSPGVFSPNSRFNLGAVHNSGQLQTPSLQYLSIQDLIKKWPLEIIRSAAALTLVFYAYGLPQALAQVLRGPRKHEQLEEDPDYLRAVERRAFLNQREFAWQYYQREVPSRFSLPFGCAPPFV
jgi:hypothetical protein